MIYRIVHRTTCRYRHTVSVGKHVACLKPRSLPCQQFVQSELHVQPTPATMTERIDYFGNLLHFFTVQEPHKELVVEARSEVRMPDDSTSGPQGSPPWEEAVKLLPSDRSPAGLEAYQFRVAAGVCRICVAVVSSPAADARGASRSHRTYPQGLSL